MNTVNGNFEAALLQLVADVVDLNNNKDKAKPAWKILSDWDKTRGTDWFKSTRRAEENLKDE